MTEKLNTLSLAALARRIADGEATSEAALRACLDRIAERDPAVQAWAYLNPEQALAEARARDREPSRGPLHGVPVAIKDVFETADMPTEYGSPAYAGHRPARDAATVALLRGAGAVVLGKSVTTEFAAAFPGKTRNPHNPAHTPGGSSSGSAAAVADFMVPAGTGTQTMGSVIRPASFCGVVGIKPTFGLVPAAGVQEEAPSVDTIGFFVRKVEDLPPLMEAAVRNKPGAWRVSLDRAPRIAVLRGPAWSNVEPAMNDVVTRAADALRAAGAAVMELPVPPLLEELQRAMFIVLRYESPRMWAYELATKTEHLSEYLKRFAKESSSVTADEFADAMRTAEKARAWIADTLWQGDGVGARGSGFDAFLTASAPGEAPRSLETTGAAVMNQAWTLSHSPCITLPYGKGPNGLPLGVQLVGARYGDAKLIAVAQWAETRLA